MAANKLDKNKTSGYCPNHKTQIFCTTKIAIANSLRAVRNSNRSAREQNVIKVSLLRVEAADAKILKLFPPEG
jgi:hypothetical protein